MFLLHFYSVRKIIPLCNRTYPPPIFPSNFSYSPPNKPLSQLHICINDPPCPVEADHMWWMGRGIDGSMGNQIVAILSEKNHPPFPSGYQLPREPRFGGGVWRIPPTSMLELGPAWSYTGMHGHEPCHGQKVAFHGTPHPYPPAPELWGRGGVWQRCPQTLILDILPSYRSLGWLLSTAKGRFSSQCSE